MMANRIAILCMTIFLIMPQNALACLTAEQNATLKNITNATNTSFDATYQLFASICSRIDNVNATASDKPNMTKYYNTTQIDAMDFVDNSSMMTSIDRLELRINGSMSKLLGTEMVTGWNASLWSEMDDHTERMEDILDEKISGLNAKFVTDDEFKNKTADLESVVYRIPSPMDAYAPYIFWALALVSLLIVVPYRMNVFPKFMNIKELRKGMPIHSTHGVDEETGETPVTKIDGIVRDFHYRISEMARTGKMTTGQATEFMDRIVKEHIRDEPDFEKMAQTYSNLNSPKGGKKIVRGRREPRGRK